MELGERVHLSPHLVSRVRTLESENIISRYVTLVNPLALRLNVSAFIRPSLEKQSTKALDIFETAIKARAEMMECCLMSGDPDYLIGGVVPDVQALKRFISDKLTTTESLANIRSSFSLQQVKYKTALPYHSRDASFRFAPNAGKYFLIEKVTELSGAGTLILDHLCAEIGQLARAEWRDDGVLKRDDDDVIQFAFRYNFAEPFELGKGRLRVLVHMKGFGCWS